MQWWTGEGCRNGIKNWWQGEYVPPPPNDPNSAVVFLTLGFYRRHWSARTVSALVTFYLRHWQFVLTSAIGLAGLVLAYLALK